MLSLRNLNFYLPDDIKNMPDYEWRVEGILPKTGTAMMFGDSRVGKSFLALDLAVKIAEGEDWFGYGVKKSGVIYIAAEGPSGIKNRIEAIEDYSGRELPKNLMVMRDPLDITDENVVDALVDAVNQMAQVIIVDTFNAATSGVDENSSRDMGTVLKSIRRIVSETDCLLIFIHHCGHNSQDRPRGHSSLQAAIDTRILVSKKYRTPRWEVVAQREGDSSTIHEFCLQTRVVNNGDSCVVVPGRQTAVNLVPMAIGKNQQIVLDTLKKRIVDSGSQQISFEEIVNHARLELKISQKHVKERVKSALDSLYKLGLIITNSDQTFSIP